MAFSMVLRRTASIVAPMAIRVIESRGSLFTPLKRSYTSGIKCAFLSRHLSSVSQKSTSNEKLLRVLESEIKCAEESDDHDRADDVPSGYPFKIQDSPGERAIYLTREYLGEKIKVEVHMPDLVTGDDNDDRDDDDDEGENQRANRSSLPMIVSVAKENLPTLEFSCVAFPDEVRIDSMTVRDQNPSEDQLPYEGPDFSDLDENLQKAFHKYIEIRGIKPSTTNYLHEYMIDKDTREYLMWLKDLKKFIEK